MVKIDNYISFIPATENPLSADIGIIKGDKRIWLYDVGNGISTLTKIKEAVNAEKETAIVLSHFHPDHIGNLTELSPAECFVGENTHKYTNTGTKVTEDIFIEDGIKIHIFPLPSSHAKGALGLEINEMYAFLGDATYATKKNGKVVYNAQLLLEEIKELKALKAKYFLLSHKAQFVQTKDQVIDELEQIYAERSKNEAYIECI